MGRFIADERLENILFDFLTMAGKTGEELFKRFEKGEKARKEGLRIKWDGSTSLKADRDADLSIRLDLLDKRDGIYKDVGFITEESCDGDKRSYNLGIFPNNAIVLVDGLDGTTNYINGDNDWCVSIALVERTESGLYMPTIGVIYKPMTDETFWAVKGAGAHREKLVRTGEYVPKTLQTSVVTTLSDFRLLVSGFHGNDPILQKVLTKTDQRCGPLMYGRLIERGSAALKMCKIAKGEAEAYFNVGARSQYDFDVAAGHLILTEAGGEFSALERMMHYNRDNLTIPGGIVATNGRAHPEFVQQIVCRLPREYLVGRPECPSELLIDEFQDGCIDVRD
jgi:myo-inositol-1(or 4)-monophosphatase